MRTLIFLLALIPSQPFAAPAPGGEGACSALAHEARRASLYRDVGLNLDFYRQELEVSGRLSPGASQDALIYASAVFAGGYTMDEAFSLTMLLCEAGATPQN